MFEHGSKYAHSAQNKKAGSHSHRPFSPDYETGVPTQNALLTF